MLPHPVLEYLGHLQGTPGRVVLALVVATLFLPGHFLQAQGTRAPLIKFPIHVGVPPVTFGKTPFGELSVSTSNYWLVSVGNIPAENFPRSNLFAVARDESRFSIASFTDLKLFKPSPWTKDKKWGGSTFTNSVTFAPTPPVSPHANQPGTAILEKYVRHIPTARPVIARIGQQAKAHPRVTRALSVFRPDF